MKTLNSSISKLGLSLVVLAFSLSSCEDFFVSEVEVSIPDYEKKLVVNGLVQMDSSLTVFVGESQSFLEEAPVGLGLVGASIRIYEDGNLVVNNPSAQGSVTWGGDTTYNYPTNLVGQFGKRYTIEVDHPNYPNTATSSFEYNDSTNIEITDVEYNYTFSNTWYDTLARVELTFTDMPGDQVYLITFNTEYSNYPYYFMSNSLILSEYAQTDSYYGSEYVFEGSRGYFDDDEFENQEITINVLVPQYFLVNDKLDLKFHTMNRDVFNYFSLLSSQNYNAYNPFAEPVIVTSNIENGLGLWGGLLVQSRAVN